MGERYTTYSDYKESGIPWVGRIPSSWEVKPTYSVFSADVEKNTNGEETNVLSLSYGNIIKRDVEKNFGLLPESFNTYQIVKDGDLILRLTDLQNDKNSLRVGLVKQKGIITSAYLKLQSSQLIEPGFAYRLLHSYDTTKVFYGMGGGLRQSMKFEDFRRLPIILPPLEEQQKIANFLDHETAKIDTLITKQEKLIELLKEKRQAMISHAVTKGLNPQAPMKDSGVEWLGEVPEHWTVTPMKYLVELTPKKSNMTASFSDTCSFVPMEKLKQDTLILDEQREISSVYDGYTYFENEDILMAKVTPCFENKNMVVARELINGIGFGSSEIYVLRCNQKAVNDFLYYRLQEDGFMNIATAAMTGAGGLKRVPADVITNFQVALPPLKEQVEITQKLKKRLIKIDALIDKAVGTIELMKERKTALISAAVTGKIDVRDWNAEGAHR
ncbi:restriction endonuclease subunit S [Vibrio breoganii]|uniref:restriction endonuclease subunit S n=1 Tax=Vibrio breoganii TaxID=553239 RepID=UPI000C842546|nr:restriction endonuclease subunit S [Vibrio breoganii]PMM44931.1 restriction endonuclease subunit S [Vibrio breoganii]